MYGDRRLGYGNEKSGKDIGVGDVGVAGERGVGGGFASVVVEGVYGVSEACGGIAADDGGDCAGSGVGSE